MLERSESIVRASSSTSPCRCSVITQPARVILGVGLSAVENARCYRRRSAALLPIGYVGMRNEYFPEVGSHR